MSVLIIIDVQNDFCSGGALEVNEGDKIIPVVNQLRIHFDRVILTQDWHPADHFSFASNHKNKHPGETIHVDGYDQILWPVHCVQGSTGAQFHKNLNIQTQDVIFKKGTDPNIDSYSAFYDNQHRKSTGLGEFLRCIGTREITVCGLATDYCVKFSVLDALAEEFKVNLIADACRGVNLRPKDSEAAITEMKNRGAKISNLLKE